MLKRIIAITFIYACTVVGFFILAGTVFVRTENQDQKLKRSVGQLWGSRHIQQAPLPYYRTEIKDRNNTTIQKTPIPLRSSDITVDIKLEHRKKGLLWYPTYTVCYNGKYQVEKTNRENEKIYVDYRFPAEQAIYDDFKLMIQGREIQNISSSSGVVTNFIDLLDGNNGEVEVSYKSQGMENWQYFFGSDISQIKNFNLVVYTDFVDIDFLDGSISPTQKELTQDGWKLTWKYSNLLTGSNIGLAMPQKLNPGPWISRVTLAAPVSLFLFFFVLFIVTSVKKIKIHPMNYFFIGAAFFSFHLLLSYLADHISIHLAFWICSVVSVFLVVSYMRLVVGTRFAFIETAIWQLIYLVIFSYTFFFEGYTGLAITILSICTLFVAMQFTGRVNWDTMFAKDEQQKTA
ncbi:MAG: inner membrane CreD family protein [Sedimentisphaerales bacterium]|nr:inner membrane CreD family protein [Sedimentisphaerales bacterium]